MLAAVVIGIIVICISGVDSGPPDLSGPKIPRAELHEMDPEHGIASELTAKQFQMHLR